MKWSTFVVLSIVWIAFSTGFLYQNRAYAIPITLDIPVVITPATSPYRLWDVTYPVPDAEVRCLALNIYFEARGEGIDGMYAVGEVTLGRVNHHSYPDTICGVVTAGVYQPWDTTMPVKDKCSFHWYCDRRPDLVTDVRAYAESLLIANKILLNPDYELLTDYALFYHADHMIPYWASSVKRTTVIGQHVFYR